ILPIVLVVKIIFWTTYCYFRSQRCRSTRDDRNILVTPHTPTIDRRPVHGHAVNAVDGMENPCYFLQPEVYHNVARSVSTPVPSYEQATKTPYYREHTNN
ncbi:Hypothetical predicted protein, partial [Mytilus galloprovincialis]